MEDWRYCNRMKKSVDGDSCNRGLTDSRTSLADDRRYFSVNVLPLGKVMRSNGNANVAAK